MLTENCHTFSISSKIFSWTNSSMCSVLNCLALIVVIPKINCSYLTAPSWASIGIEKEARHASYKEASNDMCNVDESLFIIIPHVLGVVFSGSLCACSLYGATTAPEVLANYCMVSYRILQQMARPVNDFLTRQNLGVAQIIKVLLSC